MGTNIALGKPSYSSSYIKPFSASRAVDGNSAPINRWLCDKVPCWMNVDFGTLRWFDRWVVKQMGVSGWAPNYNLTNYKLQGSNDNINWTDIDVVANNTSSATDRTFTAVGYRYARVYVTGGIGKNPGIASITELEIYEAQPTSSYLTSITLNKGTLLPDFNKDVNAYTASVAYDDTTIIITPTAEDALATIKVNGTVVASGQPSQPVELNVGTNAINIEVTPKIGYPRIYTVNVTRASSPYLTKVEVNYIDRGVPKMIPIDIIKGTNEYTADVPPRTRNVNITSYVEDINAKIFVNGTQVTNGQPSSDIPISGTTNISIVVNSGIGNDSQTYTITVE